MFHPVVIPSENGGHIARIVGTDEQGSLVNYEIHPLGDRKERAFYLRSAAEQLAAHHADYANRNGLRGLTSLRLPS